MDKQKTKRVFANGAEHCGSTCEKCIKDQCLIYGGSIEVIETISPLGAIETEIAPLLPTDN